MLREILRTRQIEGEPKRRWFHCREQDLYVWERLDGQIVGFQLCYSKDRDEHALDWGIQSGFSHLAVDNGDPHSLSNRTPLLIPDGALDRDLLTERFRALAREIQPEVAEFVLARLAECPDTLSLSSLSRPPP